MAMLEQHEDHRRRDVVRPRRWPRSRPHTRPVTRPLKAPKTKETTEEAGRRIQWERDASDSSDAIDTSDADSPLRHEAYAGRFSTGYHPIMMLDETEMARQMALVDQEAFIEIRTHQLLGKAWVDKATQSEVRIAIQ